MKKLILILLCALTAPAFAAGVGVSGSGVGGMPSAPVFGGTVSSTKACASGYVRIGPNYCTQDAQSSITQLWTDAIACTARTLAPAIPADAKLVALRLQWDTLSNNAIGQRVGTVQFWTNATCAGVNFQSAYSHAIAYEYAAVAAGSLVGRFDVVVLVEPGATNTVYATQSSAGGNGTVDIAGYAVIGYYD